MVSPEQEMGRDADVERRVQRSPIGHLPLVASIFLADLSRCQRAGREICISHGLILG